MHPIHKLCAIADIPSTGGLLVTIEGTKSVAVFNMGGEIAVADDECTHNGASLSRFGDVEGHFVNCTWHGCRFDLRTGAAMGGPCQRSLRVYAFSVEDGFVCIESRREVSGR